PERALVHQPAARESGDRGMAEGLQRAKTEEVTGRADLCPLCKAYGREGPYNHGRTLDKPATEGGETSQGAQFTSEEWLAPLEAAGEAISMDGVDPVSWTPHRWRWRSPRWQRRVSGTHRSS